MLTLTYNRQQILLDRWEGDLFNPFVKKSKKTTTIKRQNVLFIWSISSLCIYNDRAQSYCPYCTHDLNDFNESIRNS